MGLNRLSRVGALDRVSRGEFLPAGEGGSEAEESAVEAGFACQFYSGTVIKADKHKHPDLIPPVRELAQAAGLPYVIENVPGAPLKDPRGIADPSHR